MEEILGNNLKQSEREKEYTMEDFRAEIHGLQEQQRTGEPISEDLKHISIEDLTQEDFEIWKKIRDKTLSMEDIEEYRNSIRRVLRDLPEGRRRFVEFVMNRAQLLRL